MDKKRCLVITVIAVATVLFLASSCATSTNNQPIIASLEPEVERVAPLASLQVVCIASDPDGDELSYDWSANAGEISADGDTATWTAPASEGSYSVAVVVTDGRGGEVTDYVAITARTNNAPTIASLTADTDWTLPSGSLQLTCTASDPDEDELTYEWTATAGSISGTGAAVSWTAPLQIGIYSVTVVVTDDYGSSATVSLPISVVTGQPPNIEALLVMAEHCYLQTHSWGYRVGKEQEYDIECIAAHPDAELSYEWSIECRNPDTGIYEWPCDGGEFSGQGPIITWTAPNRVVFIRVTVIASDIVGNPATETVDLEVVDCSPCTFGC